MIFLVTIQFKVQVPVQKSPQFCFLPNVTVMFIVLRNVIKYK